MLKERIEEYLREQNAPRMKRAKTDEKGDSYYTFGPSRISETCQRKIALDFIREEVEAAPGKNNKAKMTFLVGNAVHTYIQTQLLGTRKYMVSCHTTPFSPKNPERLETLNRSMFKNWGARLIKNDDGTCYITADKILNRDIDLPNGIKANLAEMISKEIDEKSECVLTETWVGMTENTRHHSGSRAFSIQRGKIKPLFSAPKPGTGIPEDFFEKDITEEYESNLPGIRLVKVEPWVESKSIGGFIDAIIEDENTGKQYVLEIKTAHHEDFEKMLQTGHPLPKYIEQSTCYMGETNIQDALIFVVNKDLASKNPLDRIFGGDPDQPMFLEFHVKFNPALFQTLESRAQDLEKVVRTALDTGELPPKMENPNKFPCPWCPYRGSCHKEAYQDVPIDHPMVPEHVRAGLPELAKKVIKGRRRVETGMMEVEQAIKDIRRLFSSVPLAKSIYGDVLVVSNDDNGIDVKKRDRTKLPSHAPTEQPVPTDPFDDDPFPQR